MRSPLFQRTCSAPGRAGAPHDLLVAGAAGFIGSTVATALLSRGDAVHGIDNLTPYYDVRIKEARHEYGLTLVEWNNLPQAAATILAVTHKELLARPLSDFAE